MDSKPTLLVTELWGLGDLIIATPFLRAATKTFDVTVLAKPYAQDLQKRFWPEIKVIPFVAPWTAFTRKYRLYVWPWRQMWRILKLGHRSRFQVGLSARWDPRDHLVLWLMGAKKRIGFPRLGSRMFLTDPLQRADPQAHRYEHWRVLGHALGFELPDRPLIALPPTGRRETILIHSGAGQPVRVWPLERYQRIAAWLREKKSRVQVACDPDQRDWWLQAGETDVATPHTVEELFQLIDRAALFIGNDSGPGHLAAFSGVPTFTLFGPQLPDWFAPLHPAAEWLPGKACPYKPCSDYCRFSHPICLTGVEVNELQQSLEAFIARVPPSQTVWAT